MRAGRDRSEKTALGSRASLITTIPGARSMTLDAINYPEKPNDLEAFWMPFTANKGFKQKPRLLTRAKGMHYVTADGREILDGTAGLWCCNAGHGHEKIVAAIKAQAERMDFAPTFQLGHPAAFEFANRLVDLAPGDLDHVFFTNSGSESADTALKIALGYHYVRGKGSKTRLIGRERGYHGTNFGGTSVGGIVKNRMFYGGLLSGGDHIRHTHDLEHQAFSRGEPEWGAHLADDLERLAALHDPSTIAAVIVEPVAGSTGVLVPPKGYLRRLREICDRHDILLIFDEVITGFGRLGANFAADYFDVQPDILTTAKALTNATVPMGAVFCRARSTTPSSRTRRRGSSSSTATPIPTIRWRRRLASRRSMSTARRDCSSARRSLRPIGRMRSGRSRAATT